jgi:hypothetical protein
LLRGTFATPSAVVAPAVARPIPASLALAGMITIAMGLSLVALATGTSLAIAPLSIAALLAAIPPRLAILLLSPRLSRRGRACLVRALGGLGLG